MDSPLVGILKHPHADENARILHTVLEKPTQYLCMNL